MIKDFLMKKMLERQLKGLPKAQQEQFMGLIQKNPEFFTKIGKEIKVELKKGRPQMAATMDVMKKHQDQLRKIMQEK